jgi:hypothetical protein
MRALLVIAALGVVAPLCGCAPVGYGCYPNDCPYPPPHADIVYAPAYPVARLPPPAFDDPGADYARRGVTIWPGAGNDHDANLALQTSTPWPRNSQNTNIPGNGAQMVRATRDFEAGTRESEASKRSLQSSSGGGVGVQVNVGGGGG